MGGHRNYLREFSEAKAQSYGRNLMHSVARVSYGIEMRQLRESVMK